MVDWCNKTVGSQHLVDEVVLQTSPENENQIKQTLRDLVISLKPEFLVSSTICVSKSNKSSKQYGVSMSTTGPNAGRIVIAASCLSSYWDEYVADAVMTYYPEKTKKNYFDGTIKVPEDVTCRAYRINCGSEMEPCKSCGNLFGLHTTCQKEWPYGHCAEVESLSNLFEKEKDVKEQSKPTSDTYTPENREKVRNYTLQELCKILKMIKFNTWSGHKYLTKVSKFVDDNRYQPLSLKNPPGSMLKIATLEDTIYRDKPDEVNGWGMYYLPEMVNMEVLGVVEGTSCPSDELVLMTCEDRRLYAYDGEELHVVAPSLLQLENGEIVYPSKESYYNGQAFDDMVRRCFLRMCR
ncbi:hypothetical protein XENOCAPTIV_008861 [Xenoophorus captivus]|uniref:Uncharacterized protein n=1 Tax=Xenoophorus captivus TaxID=1517983 RepID=A0ABV0SGY0_9TELE